MVRCKLRCVERTETIGGWSVRLLPVIPKSETYPGGCVENRLFWEATPSGEVKMQFVEEPPIKVGAYYYLDMTEATEGSELWKLHTLGVGEYTLKVMLGLAWETRPTLRSGDISLDIANRSAWSAFGGVAGTKWKVTLEPAQMEPGYSYP